MTVIPAEGPESTAQSNAGHEAFTAPYFVYIMASEQSGTLYIGVTNDLLRRAAEHRTDAIPGFTKRYRVHRLVYFEPHESIEAAIHREKLLKDWDRDWKKNLIERDNPTWTDLFDNLANSSA